MSTPTAYSYVRFSSRKQEEGDSIRRQTEATAAWARRAGVRLDASLSIDRGVSAFRGKNRDLGALGEFLRQVESGRVAAGSYLVVEALDRLTRQDVQSALLLLLNLLQKGVRVVQLAPVEVVYDHKSDLSQLVIMIVELSRGHSESQVKSERVSQAWAQRRKAARSGAGIMTRRLPLWVRAEGERLALVPERAATVRLIFRLSADGHGLWAIMQRLHADGVPAFGPSGRWSIAYLDLILKDRRAVGEYQPRLRGNQPEGKPIEGYYPAAIDEATWQRARLAAMSRHRKPGRNGLVVNVFQGLVRGGLDGDSYVVGSTSVKNPHPTLKSTGPRMGRGKSSSFPLHVFEAAILSRLREIDPRDVLDGGRPDDALALAGDLKAVEGRIAAVEAEVATGDVPALARVLRSLEGQRKALAEKLEAARREAASPVRDAWGEARGILAAIESKDGRLRLRAALRRIVEGIWVVAARRGRDRLAAVQVWFSGGAGQHRDYLILFRPAKANAKVRVEGGWWCGSLANVEALGELDLRDREDARATEEGLLGLDLAFLDGERLLTPPVAQGTWRRPAGVKAGWPKHAPRAG